MTEQLSIDIHLPLDAPIGGLRYDSDGEPTDGTVLDAVITQAANIVARDVIGKIAQYGRSYDSGISNLYRQLVEPKVDAVIAERVTAALNAASGTETLGDWIKAKVDAWMKTPPKHDPYSSNNRTQLSPLDQAVANIIGRDTARALDVTMKEAKDAAIKAIASVAEPKLTEALRESIARAVR